ncbi:hypothetical protein Pa4123_81210 [Phytohabitans aurantiacus]|uniref:Uncharacterized protein n=2 Tax=Phytohabitans aurantiacus TaxID=3016789 RepID=A0ABQ5R8C6_9ACTN|nr:hypothetical protein Pa4123_81210 [Phytohabitans aurantiacus]
MTRRECQNAGMDDSPRTPSTGPAIARRALFGRLLLAAGATTALMGLAGCPGGDQDDDDDDDDGGDDD